MNPLLFLAQTEPTTSQIGVAVLIGGMALNLLLAAIQVWQATRPNPALHMQFADRDSVDSSLKRIETMLTNQEKNGRDDRRVIYSRLNRHDNALSFIAGRLERKRDMDGQQLRKILTPADDSDE